MPLIDVDKLPIEVRENVRQATHNVFTIEKLIGCSINPQEYHKLKLAFEALFGNFK